MDLAFDLDAITSPGRRVVPIHAVVVRELRPADFVMLAENRSVKPIPIAKITDRHHSAARLIAQGFTNAQVAAQLGYTESRLSILKKNDLFRELLELYRSDADVIFAETTGQMAGLSKDAVLEIRDRLEDDPSQFTIKELRETAIAFGDRTGNGPTSQQINVNITADMGTRLETARARAHASATQNLIDITPDEENANA